MDIFSAIGNTPLVQLKTLTNGTKAKIFGKLEGSNPGGSIKDRPAYYMIKKAEESGVQSAGNDLFLIRTANTPAQKS
jgi:cysteine synthase B